MDAQTQSIYWHVYGTTSFIYIADQQKTLFDKAAKQAEYITMPQAQREGTARLDVLGLVATRQALPTPTPQAPALREYDSDTVRFP